MLKDVKIEAIDQSVSMLMKKEPCNHDPVVSLASNNHTTRPVVMKSDQQAVGSFELNPTFVPTMRKEPTVAVRGSNNANNSSVRSSTAASQLHLRDPRRRPVVVPASSSLASTTLANSLSNVVVAASKSPVLVEQAAKIVVAPSSFIQSHVVEGEKGASSVASNVTKSPVVVSSKQADDVVVGGSGNGSAAAAAAAAIYHHESPVKIESSDQTKQATLDSSSSLCGDNTSSHQSIAVSSSSAVYDGDCSAKPIVLNTPTTIVSPAAYRASRRERLSSEKVYTTSIPPYDAPSKSSPPPPCSPGAAATTTTTTTTMTNTATPASSSSSSSSSAKRAAETSVDELRQREQQRVVSLNTKNDENVVAMEIMLSNLKGKLVNLTLDLCTTSNEQELSAVFCATTTQINYLKRTIASLKKDTPLLSLSDENYKKLMLMMQLTPYFQWEGNVTNPREKVFTTIYACLRQVERAVQDYEFDIGRKWKSLIPHKLSSPMHHWLDGLLIRKPDLTWPQFKSHLLQEYEMPSREAVKELTSAHYNAKTESMNSFVGRFVRNLEYSQVSEELGFAYFKSAFSTFEERVQFEVLYEHIQKHHPQEKGNIYRAIDLFRDIHNQLCACNDAFENPPLPAPQPQPYYMHHRVSQQPQQQQQRSESPKVEVVQLQQQKQKPKFKKQKFAHPKKPQFHCAIHPKAHSHFTENCRSNPNNPFFAKV